MNCYVSFLHRKFLVIFILIFILNLCVTSILRESRDNKATKAVVWRRKLIKIDNEAYIAKVLTAGIEENAPEIFISHY